MIEIITAVFIVISLAAAMYYAFVGLTKPETLMPYNKANMPRWGIQLLSVLLGTGGLLLLFPQTFVAGGILLMIHSLTTIICYLLLKDWRGGFFEFLFLLIPAFLLWAGYPFAIITSNNKKFTESKIEPRIVSIGNKKPEFADDKDERSTEWKKVNSGTHKKQYQCNTTIIQQTELGRLSALDVDSIAHVTEMQKNTDILTTFRAGLSSSETVHNIDDSMYDHDWNYSSLRSKTLKINPCNTITTLCQIKHKIKAFYELRTFKEN